MLHNGESNESPLYPEMAVFWLMLKFTETTYYYEIMITWLQNHYENDSSINHQVFISTCVQQYASALGFLSEVELKLMDTVSRTDSLAGKREFPSWKKEQPQIIPSIAWTEKKDTKVAKSGFEVF